MDYQTWLKAFDGELSHQWQGIGIDDFDPLYLQSLFHKGISPLEAARIQPVLKDLSPDPYEGSVDRSGYWTAAAAAAVALLGIMIAWRHFTANPPTRPLVETTPVSQPLHNTGDAYPAEIVNFGDFDSPAFASHAMPYHPRQYSQTGAQNRSFAGNQEGEAWTGGDSSVYFGSNDARDIPSLPSGSSSSSRSGSPASASGTSEALTPVIQDFEVTSTTRLGDSFSGQVSWQVSNADQVEILLLNTPVTTTGNLQGSLPFSGLQQGETFTIRASKGGQTVEETANVTAPS